MARRFIYVCLFVAVASCRNTYQLARRVEQSLVDRSTYLGGWPLAAVPCPSDASVACDTGISSQINQQCCPSGNTCYSWPATIPPVCCPSSQNCVGQLQNLPVCANSTWNMYELGDNNYFCCEQGQVGVIPTAGYAGICQAQGQAVPSSLLATPIDQVGAPTTKISNTTPAGTQITGINTTPTSSSNPTTTSGSVSSGTTSTPSSESSTSASSSDGKTSSGGTHLASGAIAGIAIGGGIVIAALILVLWKCSTRRSSPTQQPPFYDAVPERSVQPSSPPLNEYKVSPVVSASQVYRQVPTPRIDELSGDNRYHGRVEMEP